MTIDLSENPAATRYVEKLRAALGDMPPADRTEVVDEIRRHIADATAAGRPIDDVLTALGPVDTLARAYTVELLLNPKGAAPKRSGRWLTLAGLIALVSIPTLIIVITLSAIGISFTASGIAVFVAGVIAVNGNLPDWVRMDVPPIAAILMGPALTALGVLALWGLVAYVKAIARLLSRAVPKPA